MPLLYCIIQCQTTISLFAVLVGLLIIQEIKSLSIERRDFFIKSASLQASSFLLVNNNVQPSYAIADNPSTSTLYKNFVYSENWVGTALPKMSLEQAVLMGRSNDFDMGRWPDPILRESANKIQSDMIGSDTLKVVAHKLRRTARVHQAVGLAAQQW